MCMSGPATIPIGAMTLHIILYLKPSFANVSVNPTWESLAAGSVNDPSHNILPERCSPE